MEEFFDFWSFKCNSLEVCSIVLVEECQRLPRACLHGEQMLGEIREGSCLYTQLIILGFKSAMQFKTNKQAI